MDTDSATDVTTLSNYSPPSSIVFIYSTTISNATVSTATATSSPIDSSAILNATAVSSTNSVTTSTISTDGVDGAANSTLIRRIAQEDLPDVAQSWQDLCLVSGGDILTNDPCVQLAGISGINALLADADPCAQQDNADAMIDFAKSPGVTNADALIANAVAYRQHPRNAININGLVPSTPYCLRAPRNPELQGVVNAQLGGVNPSIFGSINLGLFAFGDDRTCPSGQTPDVSTCSCA
ncbi:hypothetical protein C8Q74DRAFT_1190287 [Fomes fomentarius]|nr:hypothetical protein C8Q74DRAFT_1190287 [Fomes fomentarius]